MTNCFGSVVAVMNRKAVEFWGQKPAPPDLAYIQFDHAHRRRVVTWAEVMQHRRERQREHLDLIRRTANVRAHKLWVAYFDQSLMGGWQAMIEDYRGRGFDVWIDRDCRRLMLPLMELFPLVLPSGSERERWERWKPEFARQYERRKQDRRPLGVTYVWWDRHGVQFVASPLPARMPMATDGMPLSKTCQNARLFKSKSSSANRNGPTGA